MHGLGVIWRNAPEQILRHYFSGLNALEAIYQIGLVPLLVGIFVSYKYISSKKDKDVYLLISFGLAVIVLSALHMMRPNFGLMYTGIVFTILFSVFLSNLWDYMENARFKPMRMLLIIAIIAALIFTNIIPSLIYIQKSMDNADISETYKALKWIEENTEKGDVVLSSLEEGHLVTFFAKRAAVIDDNFLNQKDADIRLKDVDSIYKTSYSTEAIPLLDKYKAKYILFSPTTSKSYGISSLKFISENCFELVYDKEIKIYKSLCKMETT